jgi:hypothetical protein
MVPSGAADPNHRPPAKEGRRRIDREGPRQLQAGRPKILALTTYLEMADTICERYGIRDIFLATESRDEIAMRLRSQYRFLWLDYDRSIFPDIRTSNQFIEDLALGGF